MARPTARKGTANISYRKRLPADVKRVLDGLPDGYRPKGWGKDEVVIALGTADRRKAAAEFARVSAEVEGRLEALRAGPRVLSRREAEALAGEWYRGILQDHEGEPWPNTDRLEEQHEVLEHFVPIDRDDEQQAENPTRAPYAPRQGERQLAAKGLDVDGFLQRRGLILSLESRHVFLQAAARAHLEATRVVARRIDGDYRPDPVAERFPDWKPERPEPSGNKLTLSALFDRWEAHPEQAETARRTKARYKGVFAAVAEFLKNPDARAVTTDDLRRYVEARMAEGLKPVGARDVHKAALSSIFGWAAGKKLVPGNPAEGVRIKVTKARKLRPKEASDAEVKQLVAAILAVPETAAVGTVEAARRWCLLVALYTGCRIGEACQLRRQDVTTVDDRTTIRITPEAGDVKSGEVRDVPLHSRLAELGFLSFVERSSDGPLFYDRAKRRQAKATTPQAEMVAGDLATWARLNGLGDPLLVRPLHALRHRFMSLARRAGIEGQYAEAIAGHEPGNMNRQYGTFSAAALHREIAKLRPEEVEGRA